jgi:uncharacterized protein (UPF0210 family)
MLGTNMTVGAAFLRKLETLPSDLREVFVALVEEIEISWQRIVTKDDFKQLCDIVQELAEAQKRSEERTTRLEIAVNELAEAQKKTEQRVSELAEAQKRTEEEIRKLAGGLRRAREEIGGLSRSVAYALENEAYRNLPHFLKSRHGIEIQDRLIRAEIEGEEINLFARAKKNGTEIILLGEAVLRLDDLSKLRGVMKKVRLASQAFGLEIVPIIVTHFAKKKVFTKAQESGLLVVQSFEW